MGVFLRTVRIFIGTIRFLISFLFNTSASPELLPCPLLSDLPCLRNTGGCYGYAGALPSFLPVYRRLSRYYTRPENNSSPENLLHPGLAPREQ
jgi:hypothetical protein